MIFHTKLFLSIITSISIGAIAGTTTNFAYAQFGNSSGADILSGGMEENSFLPVDQAFIPSLYWAEDGQIQLDWYIEPEHYLYRERFAYQDQSGETIEASYAEEGIRIFDEYFQRDLEVYYNQLVTPLQIAEDTSAIYIQFQGCAEAGLCYPPEWVAFDIDASIGAAGYRGLVAAGPNQPGFASGSAISANTEMTDDDDGLPITLIIGCLAGLVVLLGAVLFAYRPQKV